MRQPCLRHLCELARTVDAIKQQRIVSVLTGRVGANLWVFPSSFANPTYLGHIMGVHPVLAQFHCAAHSRSRH